MKFTMQTNKETRENQTIILYLLVCSIEKSKVKLATVV